MASPADREAPLARPATEADLVGVGAALARAFDGDPVLGFLVGNRQNRFVERAAPWFRAEAANHLRKAGLWTIDGTPGAALWSPPNQWKTTARALASILVPSVRLFGTRVPVSIAVLNAMERIHPTEPHWYLAVLGTDPSQQGHGIGSALMAPVLERCDREGTGAYLESSKERNLAFYARHGFEASDPIRPRGCAPLWPMWRDPRPPSSA